MIQLTNISDDKLEIFSFKNDSYIRIKGRPWLPKKFTDNEEISNLKQYLELTSLFTETASTDDENASFVNFARRMFGCELNSGVSRNKYWLCIVFRKLVDSWKRWNELNLRKNAHQEILLYQQ